MTDYKIPELPSDEALGIAGMDESGEAPPARTLHLGRRRRSPKPPPADGAPKPARDRSWMGPATLLILLALAWATSASRALPRGVPIGAADTTFASGRAMIDVVALSARPRPLGTAEHDAARAYLTDRLVELGLTPEVQTATVLDRQGPALVAAATVRNLVARVPGTASTGAILLTAHYDSRELTRGAGDDATGVAVVLETVRALRSDQPLRNDVIVLLSDGEEQQLLGARAFVDHHPWMADVAVALNIEMRGGGGPSVMFETGAENGAIVRALDQATPRAYAFSLTEVYRRLPNDTDFTTFRRAGVQGLNFAAIGRANVYHQAYDDPDHLDERTVQHHGVQVLGVTRVLGQRDLTQIAAADATFFPVPLVGVVVYSSVLRFALAGALVLLWLVAAVLLRRGAGSFGGVAAGLVLALAVVGVNAAAAYFARPWLAARHVEYGTLDGSAFHHEAWYAAALVALSIASATGLLTLARRAFGLGSLALGASLLPLAGALATTFVAPAAAGILQWPALFAAAGAAVVAGVGRGARIGLLRWLLMLLLAAATLAIVTPLVELLWLAFSLGAAPFAGGLVAIVALLLLPLLDTFRQPSGVVATVAALLGVALFGGAGLLQARPSAERPGPSTLLWALDHDSARAIWATLPDGGEGWASNRTGVPLVEERGLMPWMVGGGGTYLTGPAPVLDVPRVEVRVSADDAEGSGRRVTVALRSVAPILGVRLPDADVVLQRINGVDVPRTPSLRQSRPNDAEAVLTDRVRDILHYGRPEGEVTLELEVGPAATAPTIEVIEHHLSPGRLIGERWFIRPPSLAPNVVGRSDRALTRATLPLTAQAPASEVPPLAGGGETPPP